MTTARLLSIPRQPVSIVTCNKSCPDMMVDISLQWLQWRLCKSSYTVVADYKCVNKQAKAPALLAYIRHIRVAQSGHGDPVRRMMSLNLSNQIIMI